MAQMVMSETFLILTRTQRDSIISAHALHVKYPLFLSDFNTNLNFLDRFSKKYSNTKFNQNPSSGSLVFFPTDEQIDGQT
jgi:hypothetical protein